MKVVVFTVNTLPRQCCRDLSANPIRFTCLQDPSFILLMPCICCVVDSGAATKTTKKSLPKSRVQYENP